jgi:hypothetical protein
VIDIHVSDSVPIGQAIGFGDHVFMHPRDFLLLEIEMAGWRYSRAVAARERVCRLHRLRRRLPSWESIRAWAMRLP